MKNKFLLDAWLTRAHTTSVCHKVSDLTECCHGKWKPVWGKYDLLDCCQNECCVQEVSSISVLCICKYRICVMYLCNPLWLMCVYSKNFSKLFMKWTCDNSVKWYWPALYWGTLNFAICRQMYSFTGRENQCSLCLTLSTELQYTWIHEQYYTTVTCVVGN